MTTTIKPSFTVIAKLFERLRGGLRQSEVSSVICGLCLIDIEDRDGRGLMAIAQAADPYGELRKQWQSIGDPTVRRASERLLA